MKQTIKITACEDGIYAVFHEEGADELPMVFPNETKNERLGKLFLRDVRQIMDAELCNKVKITMTIEPIIEPIKDEE